jgi:transposase
MLPHAGTPRHSENADTNLSAPPVAIGVGIDTARYGHYAAFLGADLQAVAGELEIVESAAGYARLRQRFADLAARLGPVHFQVRVDAAGTYADNLLAFLERLADPADPAASLPGAAFTISCGDSQRNKNYRLAVYGQQKSDPVEARACARYALTERPNDSPTLTTASRTLRLVAGRLQAVVRQRTRLVNQLHQLLARAFPELALLVQDITTGWCLELLSRYPTVADLARASTADLQDIPYLPHGRIDALLAAARDSVASFHGPAAAELIRDQLRQVRDASARQKRLEKLLVDAYRSLPEPNHLDTIPGIGPVTAAILTALILDIDHFETPGKLVAYFGVLPIEVSSGFERDGTPRGPRRYVMARRGNDLVRRYLWLAALTASRHNPAGRALYARVRAKHPERPAIAIGHVMRKLLHLVFAIWKTRRPFDAEHYPWDRPAHVATPPSDSQVSSDEPSQPREQAAGHKPNASARSVVTATCDSNVNPAAAPVEIPAPNPPGPWLDFAHLKSQLTMPRLLDHLGKKLRITGRQGRCACPIHRGDGRGRTFSVHLDDNVYQCFDPKCGSKGDVIDLWAALHQMPLRDAALDLVQTFGLEPAPATEKRNG